MQCAARSDEPQVLLWSTSVCGGVIHLYAWTGCAQSQLNSGQARPHAPPCIATGGIDTGGAPRGETSRARIGWHVVAPHAGAASVDGLSLGDTCVVMLGMLGGIGSHTRGRAPSTHPSRGLTTHTLTAPYLLPPCTRAHQPCTK